MAEVMGNNHLHVNKNIAALIFLHCTCESCWALWPGSWEPWVRFPPLPLSIVCPLLTYLPPKSQFLHPQNADAKNICFVIFFFF